MTNPPISQEAKPAAAQVEILRIQTMYAEIKNIIM